MSRFRLLFKALGAGVLLVAAVSLGRMWMLAPALPANMPPPDDWRPAPEAVGRLAAAVTFETVSAAGPAAATAFAGFEAWLEAAFPRVHGSLRRVRIGEALLYTWPGLDPGAPAVLLLSHADVVPADAADGWTHPPFAGVVADGYVWGRGTLDDKFGVTGILEAAEALLGEGWQPEATLLFAFGYDEEIGGAGGAAAVAGHLAAHGPPVGLVLDEGLVVGEGLMPGVDVPVAMIGIAEKGYLSVRLRVRAEGGHASMPPPETAVGILARAVHRLESQPFSARIDGPPQAMLETLAPHMRGGQRWAMANLWLTGPLIRRVLLDKPSSAALLRTSTAGTMLAAGVKDNVLAREAQAVFNFRIRPGETREDVLAGIAARIADPRVALEPLSGMQMDPSPVSATDGPAWMALQRAVAAVFPDAVAAPGLVLGATDARWYAGLTPHVYRFGPVRLGPADLPRIHGVNERIAVTAYAEAVAFYRRLMLEAAGAD